MVVKEIKKRGNPNLVKGQASLNPLGRRKQLPGSKLIQARLERFIKRNASPQELQKIYSKLKPSEKLTFLTVLLPYVLAKQSSMSIGIEYGKLSDEELDKLYLNVVNTVVNSIVIPEPAKLLTDGK